MCAEILGIQCIHHLNSPIFNLRSARISSFHPMESNIKFDIQKYTNRSNASHYAYERPYPKPGTTLSIYLMESTTRTQTSKTPPMTQNHSSTIMSVLFNAVAATTNNGGRLTHTINLLTVTPQTRKAPNSLLITFPY